MIYSTQNLMEPACEVQQGDTLERIAQRYNVPWQLLAKINGIDDPHSLRPGERLKVVRGPFSAVISLEKHTLTLMLNNAYAGRFPIGIGHDSPPPEGQYFVDDAKMVNPIYYGAGPARSSAEIRPIRLARRWIGLWEVNSESTARTIRVRSAATTSARLDQPGPTATSTTCSTFSAKARKSSSRRREAAGAVQRATDSRTSYRVAVCAPRPCAPAPGHGIGTLAMVRGGRPCRPPRWAALLWFGGPCAVYDKQALDRI